MLLITTFLFAMALSLDSLGVGISYGLQKIKISPAALGVICCCSAMVLAVSMLVGQFLTKIIAVETVRLLGAGLLIGLGTFSLITGLIEVFQQPEGPILKLNVSSLGIVIEVLKEPASADADRSGVVTGKEALLLGLALSMDSFGAGIGAALLGLGIVSTSICVGICAFAFISLGERIGQHLGAVEKYQKMALLPGMILICIGISRLYL